MRYDKRLLASDELAPGIAALQQAGARGCNVTLPFKFAALGLATEASQRARLAQACNVLCFDRQQVWADNTDGAGLVQDIVHNAAYPLAGKRILLIGAGGAAAGVLGPLIEARPAHISVANRTPDKALRLVQRHAAWAAQHSCSLQSSALAQVNGAFDVVINASSSSLQGAGVPVSPQVLKPQALAYDLMYGPAAQSFTQWAKQHGAQARDGLGMLVEQAALAFAIWRKVLPPSAHVLAELRAHLQHH
jgi:shikimate dehydrogenase